MAIPPVTSPLTHYCQGLAQKILQFDDVVRSTHTTLISSLVGQLEEGTKSRLLRFNILHLSCTHIQTTTQIRYPIVKATRQTTDTMPVHPSEENASEHIFDQVAKESDNSTASDHPIHQTDESNKASAQDHKSKGPQIPDSKYRTMIVGWAAGY